MSRVLCALAVILLLALAPSLALASCTTQTVTDARTGQMRLCTTCCTGSLCNTTCY
jgi:hypothetical protein